MSAVAGQAKLHQAMKDLLVRWRKTKSHWRDDVSRRFEENHLAPLEINLRAAAEAMGQMANSVNRARRDCE